ncbi:MAG: hypothetical protein HOV86_16705 [Thermoactinospora sp.]|nr:hypothetical protein [Thermoactinospora sp.]
MRALLCAFLAFATLSACSTADEPPSRPSNPLLRAELLKMLDEDQLTRTAEVSPEQFDRVEKANTARMKQVLDQYGWPGWKMVGKDGSTAAWALVQHADLDPGFQRRGLDLLRKAVEAGDASKGDLAYLTDRVRVKDNKPQVYGTQWETDAEGKWKPQIGIENEAEVDKRRAEAGLRPLAEYLKELQGIS